MTSLLFVCHGNICRSTMAESVMTHLVQTAGRTQDFRIASAGTSREEIGNPVHRGTRNMLQEMKVPLVAHHAVQMTLQDYLQYDHLLAMDGNNLKNMLAITGGDPQQKISRLLDNTPNPRDIADPWYTGNFQITYQDVLEGCTALLNRLSQS